MSVVIVNYYKRCGGVLDDALDSSQRVLYSQGDDSATGAENSQHGHDGPL
jgi:hypothetical protein